MDVDERKRAEEALPHEDTQLRELIDTIPAMVWWSPGWPDGTGAFVNWRWAEYVGLSARCTAGSGWRSAAGWETATHPEDLGRLMDAWRGSVAAGKPLEGEVRFRRAADGEYRWFLIRGVPL